MYAGAGTSGRLALQDAAELPPTFGFKRTEVLLAGGGAAGTTAKEGAEDDAEAAQLGVEHLKVNEHDVLIGVAASGATPYTVAAVQAARTRGASTVGIANTRETPLLMAAHYPILLDTGAEVLAGSTRLAAGTAQKVVLNMLSTAVLVKLGGAYGNLMVGMNAKNAKLESRAVRIVAEAAASSLEDAAERLQHCDGDIRAAIIVLKAKVSKAKARALLNQHHNSVRAVLEELEPFGG